MEAAAPGELLSLDTFYVGKLKGVGKVWQITGCDAARMTATAESSSAAPPPQGGSAVLRFNVVCD